MFCFLLFVLASLEELRRRASCMVSLHQPPNYIHNPQTLLDAPKPGFWAQKVEWGGTSVAVGTGARVLSLCEFVSSCL